MECWNGGRVNPPAIPAFRLPFRNGRLSMGRDYKTGLVAGLILAVIALIWVATRPSLGPEARMMRSAKATPQDAEPNTANPTAPADRGSPVADSGRTDNPQSAIRNPQSPPPATTQNLSAYELPEKIKTTRFHIVRKEETLSTISQQYYGTPNNWKKILDANKTIKDPNRIQPGTKLTIPD
jgi:nucleoid-associated protein YgaU